MAGYEFYAQSTIEVKMLVQVHFLALLNLFGNMTAYFKNIAGFLYMEEMFRLIKCIMHQGIRFAR